MIWRTRKILAECGVKAPSTSPIRGRVESIKSGMDQQTDNHETANDLCLNGGGEQLGQSSNDDFGAEGEVAAGSGMRAARKGKTTRAVGTDTKGGDGRGDWCSPYDLVTLAPGDSMCLPPPRLADPSWAMDWESGWASIDRHDSPYSARPQKQLASFSELRHGPKFVA